MSFENEDIKKKKRKWGYSHLKYNSQKTRIVLVLLIIFVHEGTLSILEDSLISPHKINVIL